jgi:hypothetical protein
MQYYPASAVLMAGNSVVTLPSSLSQNYLVLLNGQLLTPQDYTRNGSLLIITGDVSRDRIDLVQLDETGSLPPEMTLEWIMYQMLSDMRAGKHCCDGSGSGASSSSASVTVTAEAVDPLADLKARLSAVQTQSMSNVISTDRQVVEVGA